MVEQLWLPKSPRAKFSSSIEIVRGPSLPPGVEDDILTVMTKGELYFHVHSVEWEQTFKPPPTCSLILHWWGLPLEQFAILAIPSLDYRPLDVTAIFPLKSGQKHLSRYFNDMGSLELVVVRDRKTWNGHEPVGSRVGTSNILLQDLDENHFINASCLLYDKAQRPLGTIFIQVQVHYKTSYRKLSSKKSCGYRKFIKKFQNKTPAASYSNLDLDALLHQKDKVPWDLPDEFAIRETPENLERTDVWPKLEFLENNQEGSDKHKWDKSGVQSHDQLTIVESSDRSPCGVRSASFSDFKDLGIGAALETAYLQGIDQETAEIVSRFGRKKLNVYSGGRGSPPFNSSDSWSSENTEETPALGFVEFDHAKGDGESSMSQAGTTSHRSKKAKQSVKLAGSSSEDMNLVLNRWFGNAAAPASEPLSLLDNRSLLDEKLDQLISDMKKGESWTSTPDSPTTKQGPKNPTPQNDDDQARTIQEILNPKVGNLEGIGKWRSEHAHHIQKRRRSASPEKGYKPSPVNMTGVEQDETLAVLNREGRSGHAYASESTRQDLSCASESRSVQIQCSDDLLLREPQTSLITDEVSGKWSSHRAAIEGDKDRYASTKDQKCYSRMLRRPAVCEAGQEIRSTMNGTPLDSNGTVRQTDLMLVRKSKEPEKTSREQASQVDSLSRIIGRAAALRDALAQASFKSRGSNLVENKKVDGLATVSCQANDVTQDSEPHSRPFVGSCDEYSGNEQQGSLAAVLRKLQDEDPAYEAERTDSTFLGRLLQFTTTNILPDGQENPREVAEEALLKELFFPGQEGTDQHAYNVIQEMGCTEHEALAVELAGHKIHSSKGPLCLAISVENLVLLDAYARDLTSCTCLLTLCFPAVKLLVADIKTSPRQVVSISPVSRRQRELGFEHQSQFHWQLPTGECGLDIWKSQFVRVNVSFKWPSSDVLRCEGSIPLESVVKSSPLAYFTDLQLIKVKEFSKAPRSGNSGTTQKNEARATSNWLKVLDDSNGHFQKKRSKDAISSPAPTLLSPSKPKSKSKPKPKVYATVRIGLRLFAESDQDGQQTKQNMKGLHQQPPELLDDRATQATERDEHKDFSWFYVSVDYFYDFRLLSEDEILDLVIKLSSDTVSRTPFSPPVYKQDLLKRGYTARQNADAVICYSSNIQTAILFVEIWRTSIELKKDGLEHLVGLIRVPLLCNNSSETVAAAEVYPVYHPVKDHSCGDANVVVMRGLKSEMLRLQNENRPSPTSQGGNFKETQANNMDGSGISITAEQTLKSSHHCAMRHVFEVKVEELVGPKLPSILCISSCLPTEGGFIKYMFPGEKEALFTQEVKWNRCMSFQASVRHTISLPAEENLKAHLENGCSNNLRFELWGYSSKLWNYEPEVLQALKNLDIASRRKKHIYRKVTPKFDTCGEQHLGTAVLPLQKMFDLVKEWRRAGSNGEVKKTFCIAVTLVEQVQDESSEALMLTVQLAYERGEAPQPENLLADTIFAVKGLVSVIDGQPLEVSLEINIIRATSLQGAINAVLLLNPCLSEAFVKGVNSYVRFSAFPGNQKLEDSYPPTSTPFKAQELVPKYGWTKYMSLLLEARVLKELRTKDMTFEVWHCSTHSTHTDVWLGTASAPCLPLLHSGEGVTGWLDLLSRKGESVGALQVAVCFTGWR